MSWNKIVPQGLPGDDGPSAYQVAVSEGFTGTETQWLSSLKGAKGEPGKDGKDGKDGIDGIGSGTVTKVNGISPNAQGEITLPLPAEPDLSEYTKKTELTAHINDGAAHGIGNKSTLNTTHKTTIVGAVNELFTNVSNGKELMATAITDKDIPASGSDTFPVLASKIGQIPSGGKSATGTGDISSLAINGLDFTPRAVVASFFKTNVYYGIVIASSDGILANMGIYIYSASSATYLNPVLTTRQGGFTMRIPYGGETWAWTAFE